MKKVLPAVSLVFSVLFMVFTKSIAMVFSVDLKDRVTYYYSHISGIPIGYGNWLPVISLVLSVVVLALLIINIKIDLHKAITVCLAIAMVCLFVSWMLFKSFTYWSLAIFFLQAVSFYIFIIVNEKS